MEVYCITERIGSKWFYERKYADYGMIGIYYRRRFPSWTLGITRCIGGWNYHMAML